MSMRELTLKEIQTNTKDVLKKFADICENNNFRYFLYGGTLLGAVRDKDIIPWDDDVDVIMPRPDYEQFVDYCISYSNDISPYVLFHWKTNKKYIYPIARLSDSRYVIDDHNNVDCGLGLFIDIYPLDGYGNTFEEAREIKNKHKLLKGMVTSLGSKRCEISDKGMVFNIVKVVLWHIGRLIGNNFFIKRIDLINRKRKYEKYKYVKCTNWEPVRFFVLYREDLEKYKYEFFGDYKYRIPFGYDRMLKDIYGDYMSPPDEAKRHPDHAYRAYKK